MIKLWNYVILKIKNYQTSAESYEIQDATHESSVKYCTARNNSIAWALNTILAWDDIDHLQHKSQWHWWTLTIQDENMMNEIKTLHHRQDDSLTNKQTNTLYLILNQGTDQSVGKKHLRVCKHQAQFHMRHDIIFFSFLGPCWGNSEF